MDSVFGGLRYLRIRKNLRMEDGGSVFKKMGFQYIVQANDMAS